MRAKKIKTVSLGGETCKGVEQFDHLTPQQIGKSRQNIERSYPVDMHPNSMQAHLARMNKTAGDLKNAMIESLLKRRDEYGTHIIEKAIVTCALTRPHDILALATRIIPREIDQQAATFAPIVVNVGSASVEIGGE